ncbi:MAG TPA: 4-(cytidine 5'-diphospho)-2-C-methyl-D-erythritol kinase [Bryobacteraceae bacterium]|nr:4-(cytidine 5'-diphospho)-2-C-methyl-D-erythritol kinase [Bryobacteraceae bacterium]
MKRFEPGLGQAGLRQGGLRRARVAALAKINLDLRVLGKRPDGYHELRTIFQTISLADTLEVRFVPGRRTTIELLDPQHIPGNLALRAAEVAVEAMNARGAVFLYLRKRIPMGAGLGGGSSDAAAVLLALNALAGRPLPLHRLCELGASLGSDVPFFLLGGAAVGIGRGTELFPLPDTPSQCGLLAAPDVPVSTAEAYAALSPRLTTKSQENKIVSFQSLVWDRGVPKPACNDFEAVVFERHKRLARLKQRFLDVGASTALMTGSGSAIFGLFRSDAVRRSALEKLNHTQSGERFFRFSLVNRSRYRLRWWRALESHIDQKTWPPQSRYAR